MAGGRSKREADDLPLAVASAEGPGVPVGEMLDDAASALQLESVTGEAGEQLEDL